MQHCRTILVKKEGIRQGEGKELGLSNLHIIPEN
jgi:hypothetical protein